MASRQRVEPILDLITSFDNGGAGCSWSSRTTFTVRARHIVTRLTSEGEVYTKWFSRKPSPWRAIAKFLADTSDGWGVPSGSWTIIQADQLAKYQSDVILFCMMRYEDDCTSLWGRRLLTLSDAWLEEAFGLYGSLNLSLDAVHRIDSSFRDMEFESDEPDDEDQIDEPIRDIDLDFTLLLRLMSDEGLTQEVLAELLGFGKSTTPYVDTVRCLRERHQQFVASFESLSAQQYEPPEKPLHRWAASSHYDAHQQKMAGLHRRYLLFGDHSPAE